MWPRFPCKINNSTGQAFVMEVYCRPVSLLGLASKVRLLIMSPTTYPIRTDFKGKKKEKLSWNWREYFCTHLGLRSVITEWCFLPGWWPSEVCDWPFMCFGGYFSRAVGSAYFLKYWLKFFPCSFRLTDHIANLLYSQYYATVLCYMTEIVRQYWIMEAISLRQHFICTE